MLLLITHDRFRADQDYSRLHKEIKKANKWWHHMESTWIVSTNLTPTQWADRLRRHLDDVDHLLVIEIAGNYDGWLPECAWNWLRKRNFAASTSSVA